MSPEEYMEKLVDYCLIKIYAIANVKETRQTWSEEDDFPLQKPKLKVEVREKDCFKRKRLILRTLAFHQ